VSFDYLANLSKLKNFFEGWAGVRGGTQKSLIKGYGREKRLGTAALLHRMISGQARGWGVPEAVSTVASSA
jgi:hypothetical protein